MVIDDIRTFVSTTAYIISPSFFPRCVYLRIDLLEGRLDRESLFHESPDLQETVHGLLIWSFSADISKGIRLSRTTALANMLMAAAILMPKASHIFENSFFSESSMRMLKVDCVMISYRSCNDKNEPVTTQYRPLSSYLR